MDPTGGIKITHWIVRINRDEKVRLNIWDFGGQEILHSTHQLFLTKRSLYLLVLSGREGDVERDAEYWLTLIKSFSDESPVIVVLNKIKEYPFEVKNRRKLQKKYPFIREFVKTDCRDKTGIEELRKSITRETDRLEHLRYPFPPTWVAIKDSLESMEANYMSFDAYRELCTRHGLTERSDQDVLADHLHKLGTILNYRGHERLRDTNVLDPDWLTKGFYSILMSARIKEREGEFYLRDLESILPPDAYPMSTHRFLVDLMEKFYLCFSFPYRRDPLDDDPDYSVSEETDAVDDSAAEDKEAVDGSAVSRRYLIPGLLPDDEPEEVATDFNPEECLNFQYDYPVLPEGLLPLFIVQNHSSIKNDLRWRSGVVLRFEANSALVRADMNDKRVFILVSGPPSGRRALLAIIRREFGDIHEYIRGLHPEELVPVPKYPGLVVKYRHLLVRHAAGEKQWTEVFGDKVVELYVDMLLDGVDVRVGSTNAVVVADNSQPVRLFYSYSHKDEWLRDELEVHIKALHY